MFYCNEWLLFDLRPNINLCAVNYVEAVEAVRTCTFHHFTIKLNGKIESFKKTKIEIYANKTLINYKRIDVLSGSENLYKYFNYQFFLLPFNQE